ncbi:MAG: hypothetical protein IIB10_13615, partial [Chloroflexi bacterium]|nr:hypothetical protein [Chloroflexota bacterium]
MTRKRNKPQKRPKESKPRHFYAVLNERMTLEAAAESREDLAAVNTANGIQRIRHPYARVDVARNRIQKAFMANASHPDDSLTMLDNDHVHHPETVLRLISHNVDVVGALAFRRGEPYDPQIYVKGENGEYQQPADWKPSLLKGTIVGAAAICIRKKVFDKLEAAGIHYPYFRMMYTDNKDHFLGEDWYFGLLCDEVGIPHHCDMGLIAPHIDNLFIGDKPWRMRQGNYSPDANERMRPEPWYQDDGNQDLEGKWSELKDYHKGETCVIIGNGPSLKDVPLDFLKAYPTFGLNRINLMDDFEPYYHVAVNPLVLEQFGEEILEAYKGKVRRFFLRQDWITKIQGLNMQPSVIPIRSLSNEKFYGDPRAGLYEGHTVTYVAMQIAYWMGFKTVLLVGIDHSYQFGGVPNEERIWKGNDPNHFHPEYFKGKKWNNPDLVMSQRAYRLAREAFEADGRRIVNLTAGTKLEVFEKGELAEWMEKRP